MSKSFSDADTEFRLVRSDTPVTEDGYKIGELTGIVECLECGERHQNIDEIPHAPDCPQRWVRSQWWAAHLR